MNVNFTKRLGPNACCGSSRSKPGHVIKIALFGLATVVVILLAGRMAFAAVLPGPSHSSNIALTFDDQRVVVANRETNTVSVIRVRNATNTADVNQKLAEVAVDIEPRCVAITPDNARAFVTNGVSGTVVVVSLVNYAILRKIQVGTEPRGCALTPSGKVLYVANHTSGTVSVINTDTYAVIRTISLGGNPHAVAITNVGHGDDTAENIFVTDFFGRLIPGKREGFDDGKQGLIWSFPFSSPTTVTVIKLAPISNVGFTADRSPFCKKSNPAVQSEIFCPDPTAPPGSPVITQNPQGCFPNQLFSVVIRGSRLRLTDICAEPAPPVQFTVNIQAVMESVDTTSFKEVVGEQVNLNAQIKTEPTPANPTQTLAKLFGGDLAAVDANAGGTVFLIVSRNNDYVVRATVGVGGKLDIHAPNPIRFRTGHTPTGIVVSKDGKRAYTNNEVDTSVSRLNLQTNTVINPAIVASLPPSPGTVAGNVRLGKLVFFTGLGVPNGYSIFSTPIQSINTLSNRGKASSNGWSSCASCHPDGLSDHVTWIFAAGPRSTSPLDATIDKDNPYNSRVLLWSALRDSNVDFNNNSRGVQGGLGFAGDPPNPAIYDHGILEGVAAFDALTTWVQIGARPLFQPQPPPSANLTRGKTVFNTNCAPCHGGPKWTKSQIFYIDNPSFNKDPANGGAPLDPGVANAGAQIISLTRSGHTFKYLEDVGTFNSLSDTEIRGAGAMAGQKALGSLGFNVPSLLSIAYHAPFLHNGVAQRLVDVFPRHTLPGGMTITSKLSTSDQNDLLLFLNSIDGRTVPFRSQAEDFRDGGG